MEIRHGDDYNVKCPHCEKINHYVTRRIDVVFGQITQFEKPCFHCGGIVYYRAGYKVGVEAFSENPVKLQKSI